ALVHHPLALETGLSAADAEWLRRSERAALAAVRHVVVTGGVTARLLASDYGVPKERISIARPGTDPVQPSRGSDDGTLALLAVGALVPRKGYDVLLAALATLTHLSWRLTVAGARDRGAETAAALEAAIERLRLQDRVDLAGAVSDERLAALYGGA